MSSYPSLVTDACELLRSLLFPFELCAPYVPRLTQPFMSVLNFPGAIFAGKAIICLHQVSIVHVHADNQYLSNAVLKTIC